jgi:hypothetical protein
MSESGPRGFDHGISKSRRERLRTAVIKKHDINTALTGTSRLVDD